MSPELVTEFGSAIPICLSVSKISRKIFGYRDAAVMSGKPREQTRMELSIFRRRRSIRYRLRRRRRYFAPGSRSARVIWTNGNASNALILRTLFHQLAVGSWPRRRGALFPGPPHALIPNILA